MSTPPDRPDPPADDGGEIPGGGCPKCRHFAIEGMREMASVVLDGHHPSCPTGLGRRLGPDLSLADYSLISDLVDRLESARRDERERIAKRFEDKAQFWAKEAHGTKNPILRKKGWARMDFYREAAQIAREPPPE